MDVFDDEDAKDTSTLFVRKPNTVSSHEDIERRENEQFLIEMENYEDDTFDLPQGPSYDSDPQQSFLFGADVSSKRQISVTPPKKGKQREGQINAQFVAPTSTLTNWPMVLRHWILSTLVLPIYVVALITKSWKDNPGQVSKRVGSIIILFSFLFYSTLILMISIFSTSSQVHSIFPVQQVLFVVFIYLMCCFAEGMLKHTRVVTDVDSIVVTNNNSLQDTVHEVKDHLVSANITITTLQNNRWSLSTFLDTITFISNPSRSCQNTPLIVSFVLATFYAGGVIAMHVYVVLKTSNESFGALLVIYILCVTFLQWFMSFCILFTLGQVALRLSTREKVVKVFKESTLFSKGDHAFRLTTLENVKAWQMLRDTLLSRYGFPSIYVDVVVSAAFTLWVPLVLIGVIDFLFQSQITMLALNASALAILILIFLLACVAIASGVQDTLSSTETLRKQEFSILVSNNLPSDQQAKLEHVLERLSELIEHDRDNAVVFQVWGFPLNKRMVIFLGGVLVTLSSSVLVRIASKLT